MAHEVHRTAGMTLLEVLVALLVVTVGLLGVGALNAAGLRANRTAQLRSQAVRLAADLADRIRANSRPADAYDCRGRCEPGSGGNAVAVADIAAWTAAVAAALPAGRAEITHAAAATGVPDTYVVRVSWDEAGAGGRSTCQLRVQRWGRP